MGESCTKNGEKKVRCFQNSSKKKPIENIILGRPRRTWEGNIWIDLKEIGINIRNWVDQAQDTIIGETLWTKFPASISRGVI